MTYKARVGGLGIFFTVSEYEDGTPGELFIDTCKSGAALRSLYNCLAIAVSLGLQYGVPLEEFVRFFAHVKFEPSGITEGHEDVKSASSVVDFIFRVLGVDYLKVKGYSAHPDQKSELIYKTTEEVTHA